MPFYELIFETGDDSITEAESDEAVLVGVRNQHERAKRGEVGGPAGARAERVVRVLRYERHPADLPTAVSGDEANARMTELFDANKDENGVVDLTAVAGALEPRARVESGPHESNYAMQEESELKSKEWDK